MNGLPIICTHKEWIASQLRHPQIHIVYIVWKVSFYFEWQVFFSFYYENKRLGWYTSIKISKINTTWKQYFPPQLDPLGQVTPIKMVVLKSTNTTWFDCLTGGFTSCLFQSGAELASMMEFISVILGLWWKLWTATDRDRSSEGIWVDSLWNFQCLMQNLGIWCCETGSETISGTTSSRIDAWISNPRPPSAVCCYAADC